MQKEYIGVGSVGRLGEVLVSFGAKRVFLVAGRSSYSGSGAEKAIAPVLSEYTVERYSEFSANPQASDIERGVARFKKFAPDVILAVGGGSPMDVAKVVGLFAKNNVSTKDWFAGKIPSEIKRVPLIAITTTAGSGSEATQFGVFYDGKEKLSLAEESILPDVVIIDPALMMSLPEYQVAATGMDALAQAIESYWSIYSTDESKAFAREAIQLAIENVVATVKTPSLENRKKMAVAANSAGKAINITRTTACHAVAYPFTSHYGVAHGHAVALTLGSMFKFIDGVTESDILDKRGCGYVRQMLGELVRFFGAGGVDDCALRINGMMKEIGLETKISRLGLETDADIEVIVRNGFAPERVKNMPRLLTAEHLRKMLIKMM